MNFKPIETVFEISESFLKDSKYVKINDSKLLELSKQMKLSPVVIPVLAPTNLEGEVIRDILKNSINYCYWYGRADIRPNNSCASKLGKIIDECFTNEYDYEKSTDLSTIFTKFLCQITEERFPLIEERSNHIKRTLPYVKKLALQILKNKTLNRN
jgi:hypothetical protein